MAAKRLTAKGAGLKGVATVVNNHATELDELFADVTAIRASLVTLLADVTAIHNAVTGITAQLDGDSGVNETTYASGNDPAAVTTATPATITADGSNDTLV
jgi:hypothetical protein